MKKVCVIGAGVIGLSSAKCIVETIPDVEVTVISEKFTPYTVGDGSAGFWFPHLLSNTPVDSLRRWSISTYDMLADLAKSADGISSGCHFVSGYQVFTSEEHARTDATPFGDLLLRYNQMSQKELELFSEFGVTSGVFFTTILCDCKAYLPWITNKLKSHGVQFIQKAVQSFDELKEFDVIVNCTGLGAKQLTQDQTLHPVRGQVLTVQAPWVKHFVFVNDCDYYIFPKKNSLTLGGTHTETYNTDISENDRKHIWDGCCKLIPSLKDAVLEDQWAGLRPARERVRLEAERRGSTHIVHNYGHGGGGVTLHWGCAQDAAALVTKALSSAKL